MQRGVPIPDSNKYGLLPPGIFDCTFAEIEAKYAVANQRQKREELWKLFTDYLSKIRPIGLVIAVFVDGSFITNKPLPSDIDLVLELPPPSPVTLQALMRPEFDRTFVKPKYKMDIFHWFPGASPDADWVAYFQEIKPKDLVKLRLKPSSRKGILRVAI